MGWFTMTGDWQRAGEAWFRLNQPEQYRKHRELDPLDPERPQRAPEVEAA